MQPIHSTTYPYNRYVFTAKSHGMHYEIDATDLVSTVVKIEDELKSSRKLWMRMSAGEYLRDLNGRIASSHVTVLSKDYGDSLMKRKCSSRIIIGWSNVYLKFTASDGKNIYEYDFPLMSKIGFVCPCFPFLLWGRNVRIDKLSMRSGNLAKSINEGMMSCKITSVHRKAKIITGFLLAAVATISLGSPQVLAYFSM